MPVVRWVVARLLLGVATATLPTWLRRHLLEVLVPLRSLHVPRLVVVLLMRFHVLLLRLLTVQRVSLLLVPNGILVVPPSTDTATSVETRTRMTPEPINRRDSQDASPTTRAPARARRGAQDASPTRSAVGEVPASIQKLIDEAPGGAARSQAERIRDQVRAGRMPLRDAINRINEIFSNVPSLMAGRNEEMRQRRAAAGMAKGGMAKKQGYNLGGTVKKGNTDRRKTGMFYDSKSPRGYK